jgi:hypothetical protein
VLKFLGPPLKRHVCQMLVGATSPPSSLSAEDRVIRIPRLMKGMNIVELAGRIPALAQRGAAGMGFTAVGRGLPGAGGGPGMQRHPLLSGAGLFGPVSMVNSTGGAMPMGVLRRVGGEDALTDARYDDRHRLQVYAQLPGGPMTRGGAPVARAGGPLIHAAPAPYGMPQPYPGAPQPYHGAPQPYPAAPYYSGYPTAAPPAAPSLFNGPLLSHAGMYGAPPPQHGRAQPPYPPQPSRDPYAGGYFRR